MSRESIALSIVPYFFFVMEEMIGIIILILLIIAINVYIIEPKIDIVYSSHNKYRILLWYNSISECKRKYIILYTNE